MGGLLTLFLIRSKYNVRFRSGTFFENLGDKLIYDDIELEINLKLLNMNPNRPRCGCGNTQDPEGFCDGSHSSQ